MLYYSENLVHVLWSLLGEGIGYMFRVFLQEAHSRFTFMRIPKVFDHLSRKRVLTLEWVVGESPTELISLLSNNINNDGSVYSDRQHIDVKRRLLDMVGVIYLHFYLIIHFQLFFKLWDLKMDFLLHYNLQVYLT